MKNKEKNEIDKIDDLIGKERKCINHLENIDNEITKLNNSINTCIDLFAVSMKSSKSAELFSDIKNEGLELRKESTVQIEQEISECLNQIENYENKKKNIRKHEDNNDEDDESERNDNENY